MEMTLNNDMMVLSQDETDLVGGGIVVATLLVWAGCSFVAGATLTIAAYAATHN